MSPQARTSLTQAQKDVLQSYREWSRILSPYQLKFYNDPELAEGRALFESLMEVVDVSSSKVESVEGTPEKKKDEKEHEEEHENDKMDEDKHKENKQKVAEPTLLVSEKEVGLEASLMQEGFKI